MLPNRSVVENLKYLVLHSEDSRTAAQLLLNMLQYYSDSWQQTACPQGAQNLLTVLQAFCELGLGWKSHFTQLLKDNSLQSWQQPLLEQINFSAMEQKPTKQNINTLLHWHSCRKNPLQPTKKELATLIYQICQQPPQLQCSYVFYSDQQQYLLYWQMDCWHLQDQRKQVCWLLKK